jgi:hypothetical protein
MECGHTATLHRFALQGDCLDTHGAHVPLTVTWLGPLATPKVKSGSTRRPRADPPPVLLEDGGFYSGEHLK